MKEQQKNISLGRDHLGNPIHPKAEDHVTAADQIMSDARARGVGSYVRIDFDPVSGEPISTVINTSDRIRVDQIR